MTTPGPVVVVTLYRDPQSRADTAAPYRFNVDEALLQWLMSAPDGPDEQLTLEDFLQRPAWQRDAACAGAGVKTFFSATSADIDRARAVCHTCPVQAAWLQCALGDDTLAVVWAETNERERRELRRGRVA